MKLLVVFTGGTIGCAPPGKQGIMAVEKNIAPKNENDYYLISEYKKRNKETAKKIKFEVIEPLQTLSENITFVHWNILLDALRSISFNDYDGIIITHGTDTMAYSASLFGMLLSGITIPVVFVGSNINLYLPDSDGHKNFSDAIDFIRTSGLCGTFVVFDSTVYLSTRIMQSKHFTDSFESAGGFSFGVMDNGRFKALQHKSNPNADEFLQCTSEPLICKINRLSDCILLIQPYIGLNYNVFELNDRIKAILHETYHSFTACTDSSVGGCSMIGFADKCAMHGKQLYLAPFDKQLVSDENAPKYASTDLILKHKIRYMGLMTLESAYSKLVLAYSLFNNEHDINDFLEATVFFETL